MNLKKINTLSNCANCRHWNSFGGCQIEDPCAWNGKPTPSRWEPDAIYNEEIYEQKH